MEKSVGCQKIVKQTFSWMGRSMIKASLLICVLAAALAGNGQTRHGQKEAGQQSAAAVGQTADIPNIWFDDIVTPESGQAFEQVFAAEPSCAGVSLMLWSNRSSAERMQGLKAKWWLAAVYRGSNYVSVGLYRNFDYKQDFGFHALSVRDAARKVCSIVKREGVSKLFRLTSQSMPVSFPRPRLLRLQVQALCHNINSSPRRTRKTSQR